LLDTLGQEKGKEAWYAVRTEGFKDWFGDWEALKHREFLDGSPIKTLQGTEFEPDGQRLSTKVLKWLSDNNLANIETAIGKVRLDERSIKSTIAHGLTRKKAAAFAAVPEVLQNGRIINASRKKNLTGYLFAAPVNIGTDDCIVLALVRADNNTKRLYVHEVALKENIPASTFKTEALTAQKDALNGADVGTLKNIIRRIYSVKPDSVSKIVDENGEPQAVFHQTQNQFEIYDLKRSGAGAEDDQTPYGIFLKPDTKDLGLGDIQMPLFANINNPLTTTSRNNIEQRLKTVSDYAEMSARLKENDTKYGKLLDEAEAEEDQAYKQWWEGSRASPFESDGKAEAVLGAWKKENGTISKRKKDMVQDYMKKNGYDGMVLEHDEGSHGRSTKTIIALNPNQIKSATENAGTFSNDDYSMLFQTAYQDSPYIFDKHDNSYVGRGLGNLRFGWGHYLYGQKEAAEWFSQAISKYKGVEGQLYHVDIPGNEELLLWEKPIAEQADVVRQAADKLITWNKDGASNFNKAYNLRKFNDGSYGFWRI